jgi:hypothetical protein
MGTKIMTRAQTLRGALPRLCSQTSKAWKQAAVSGTDIDIERAYRLSSMTDELASTYEDAICDFDDLLKDHSQAFNYASDLTSEWALGEIN